MADILDLIPVGGGVSPANEVKIAQLLRASAEEMAGQTDDPAEKAQIYGDAKQSIIDILGMGAGVRPEASRKVGLPDIDLPEGAFTIPSAPVPSDIRLLRQTRNNPAAEVMAGLGNRVVPSLELLAEGAVPFYGRDDPYNAYADRLGNSVDRLKTLGPPAKPVRIIDEIISYFTDPRVDSLRDRKGGSDVFPSFGPLPVPGYVPQRAIDEFSPEDLAKVKEDKEGTTDKKEAGDKKPSAKDIAIRDAALQREDKIIADYFNRMRAEKGAGRQKNKNGLDDLIQGLAVAALVAAGGNSRHALVAGLLGAGASKGNREAKAAKARKQAFGERRAVADIDKIISETMKNTADTTSAQVKAELDSRAQIETLTSKPFLNAETGEMVLNPNLWDFIFANRNNRQGALAAERILLQLEKIVRDQKRWYDLDDLPKMQQSPLWSKQLGDLQRIAGRKLRINQ